MKTFKLLPSLVILAMVTSIGMAVMVDLTTEGSSGTVNGAIYSQLTLITATGSGAIDPFLRTQASPVEEGFNTDATVSLDTVAGIHTHSLMLSDVKTVNYLGTDYREFLLDINEAGGSATTLSLDMLKIYVESSPTIATLGGLTNMIYDLGDNYIMLDMALSGSGSGRYDMLLLVPDALFTGGSYVYFYNKFGVNASSSDGFEEWATDDPFNPPIPEPATILLLTVGGALLRVKKS